MFKIIVLKSQYNLSDEMTEFFIRDRKTFQDFLGITPYHTIPDAKTILARYKHSAEQMKNAHLDEVLFDKFLDMLESKGIKPQKDHPCVDAFWKLIWGYGVTTAKVAGLNTCLGEQKMRMKDETLRSIGFARAKFWIGIRTLDSNINRYLTLRKLGRVN